MVTPCNQFIVFIPLINKVYYVVGFAPQSLVKKSLLMDSTLRPSHNSHITFANTGKSKVLGLGRVAISKHQHMDNTTKKDTSVTFWVERIFFCHAYDTSLTIIVTKRGIIIDVVGCYLYDKKS